MVDVCSSHQKRKNIFFLQESCGPMMLDALLKIKNELDPTLTLRRSCREGNACVLLLCSDFV